MAKQLKQKDKKETRVGTEEKNSSSFLTLDGKKQDIFFILILSIIVLLSYNKIVFSSTFENNTEYPNNPLGWFYKTIFPSDGFAYIITLLIGAVCFYFFIKRKQLKPFSAFFGTFSFIFAPNLVSYITQGELYKVWAICYIPLVLISIDYLFSIRNTKFLIISSLAFLAQLWTNGLQIFYYTIFLCILYYIFLSFDNIKQKNYSKIAYSFAFLLAGIIISSSITFVMNFLNVLSFSQIAVNGSLNLVNPKELISLLFPSFYGLNGQTYWGYLGDNAVSSYFGFTVLIFSTSALIFSKNHQIYFWTTTSIILIITGMFINSVAYSLLPLTFSILSGYGINYFINLEVPSENQKIEDKVKSVLKVSSGIITIIFILFLIFGRNIGDSLISSGWFSTASDAQFEKNIIEQLKIMRYDMFFKDILRFLTILGFSIYLISMFFIVTDKFKRMIFYILTLIMLDVDLWVINNNIYEGKERKVVENTQLKN